MIASCVVASLTTLLVFCAMAADVGVGGVVGDQTPPLETDRPVALTWLAPAGCPGIDALRAEIRRVAGSFPPPGESLAADATIQRGPGDNWQLVLITRAGSRAGERRLVASDCGELMRAAALVVALMINPAAAATPTPAPIPQAAPPPAEVVVTSPNARRARWLAAGVEFMLGTGALPGIGPGAGLRLAAKRGAFAGEIRGSLWGARTIPTPSPTPSDGETGGTFRLLDVGVAGCGSVWRDRRFSPGLCVGATVARLRGTGYGVTEPGAASAWWTAAFVEGGGRLRVTERHGVRLALQTLASLGRPAFALAGVGPIFEPQWVWVRGTIGWEMTF